MRPRLRKLSIRDGADHVVRSRRAFFGTIALSAVNSGRLALQIVVLPILARILGPSAIGLVAMAMPFILFANMLADAGMGNALVRYQEPTPEIESTIFWLATGVGAVIAVIIWIAAIPMAHMMHQPGLAPVLVALSPILILCSSLSVPNARISRARHFGLFAVGDFLSTILSSGAAIVTALNGYGAWSLVIQQLVLWLTKALWTVPISGFWPRMICRPSAARSVMVFGLNDVGANVADFLGKSSPALVIGGLLGVSAAGHYAMAYQLVRIPDLVLSGPLFLATFTAVSATASSSSGPTPLSMRALRMVVSVLAPLFAGMALVSGLLIEVFLGPKWQGTATVLSTLAGAGFFLSLYSLIGAVLMGLGRPDLQFRLAMLCAACVFAGVMLGSRYGLEASATGITIGAAVVFPFYVKTLSGQLNTDVRTILGNVGGPLIAAGFMTLAVIVVRDRLAGLDPGLQLAAVVATGVVTFGTALSLTSGRQILEDLKQILPRAHAPHEAA